ncbi:predicted protein [Lichtheimia corymbifera JMRC:FSU:9682]|uniref:Uncharacterized protein n=1 Tax=Lichtheimia corymbifera JMRC:FSU:9682 TaxID=1263082 RepID=A0A068RYP5_9FUNG|nr:predicted protein [Lichtheimia corymbifera JMRC:FSU:9682]
MQLSLKLSLYLLFLIGLITTKVMAGGSWDDDDDDDDDDYDDDDYDDWNKMPDAGKGGFPPTSSVGSMHPPNGPGAQPVPTYPPGGYYPPPSDGAGSTTTVTFTQLITETVTTTTHPSASNTDTTNPDNNDTSGSSSMFHVGAAQWISTAGVLVAAAFFSTQLI